MKKLLSLVLALVLTLSLVSGLGVTAYADDEFVTTDYQYGLPVGENYIFIFSLEGEEYAIGTDGKAVKYTGQNDDTVLWNVDKEGNLGVGLISKDGNRLYYDKTAMVIVTTTEDKAHWNYTGMLFYTGGGSSYHVSGLDGDTIKVSKDAGLPITVKTPEGKVLKVTSTSTSTDSTTTETTTETTSSGGWNRWMGAIELTEKTPIAIEVSGKTLAAKKGQIVTADAQIESEVMTIDANDLYVEPVDGGYHLYFQSSKGNNYLYITDDGAIAGSVYTPYEGELGAWTIANNHGSATTTFKYTVGDTSWYLRLDENGEFTTTQDEALAGQGDIYSNAASAGTGGTTSTTTVDADAPVITAQPEIVHYVIEGSDYAAPEFTVSAALPEGSGAKGISLQWYLNGEPMGKKSFTKGTEASYTYTAEELLNRPAGVYSVYCNASCMLDGAEHSADSYTVNFIVCRGVLRNSVITFSDVHQVWDNVGVAIQDTIVAHDGLIPSLVISTGDWNNKYITGNVEEYLKQCNEEIIGRIALQLGGIDTVWVSGNHDNGYAAEYTNWNSGIDLGIVLENYFKAENGISGTGIIFDTRSEGYEKNAESSAEAGGLIVIGINFEDALAAQSGSANGNYEKALCDYGNGTEPSDSVYKRLKTALDSAAADYNGELVIISTHSGVHVVGLDPDSTASSVYKDADYCITNSNALVKLVNSYVDEYGLNVLWLFGHDHSKGEEEFVKVPGDTIVSAVNFAEQTSEELTLKFTYAHAGYITDNSSMQGYSRYSFLTWDENGMTRKMDVANKEKDALKEKLNFKVTFTTKNVNGYNPKTFKDVPETHWAAKSISKVVEAGLFSGVSDTLFAPEGTATRGMLAVVLARFDGKDTTVTSGNWYSKGLGWANKKGILDSKDEEVITRGEMVTALWKYAGEPSSDAALDAYSDAGEIGEASAGAFKWAVENGLIKGVDEDLILPDGEATRAQLAAIMERYISLVK